MIIGRKLYWFCRRVTEGLLLRQNVMKELGINGNVRATLQRLAGRMTPPHVVERHYKGKPFQVAFQLRPATRLEAPGALIDVAQ